MDYLNWGARGAPLTAKDKVMVGVSGGEFGIRGFIPAYDPESENELWKTYTIPGPGESGHDTWKTGGASVWVFAFSEQG